MPKSVAVVGSSVQVEPGTIATPSLFAQVRADLLQRFQGEVCCIDIGSWAGEGPLPTELPKADLYILTTARPPTLRLVEELAQQRLTRAIIVLSGGYTEEEERRMVDTVRAAGIRLLGPNSVMGVVNAHIGLQTTFGTSTELQAGNCSFLAQSGGVGAAILDLCTFYRVGVRYVMFVGDKADVSERDFARYCAEDPETRAVGMYVEDLREGRNTVEVLRELSKRKPLVILRGGVSEEAAARAASHTKALATGGFLWTAVLHAAGAVGVSSVEELVVAVHALATQAPLKGKRIAVVSNVGGPATLTTDLLVEEGFAIPALSQNTKEALVEALPAIEPINPLDVYADADGERLCRATEIVLKDQRVDGVLVIAMLKSCLLDPRELGVFEQLPESDKPVVVLAVGDQDFRQVRRWLPPRFPAVNTPRLAVAALRALWRRYHLAKEA